MKGYLVNLRIVKRSHDHRGLTIWIDHADDLYPYLNASNEQEAEEAALWLLDKAAESVTDPSTWHLGVVSVNSVRFVDTEALVGGEIL
jgi:hypothetical protein